MERWSTDLNFSVDRESRTHTPPEEGRSKGGVGEWSKDDEEGGPGWTRGVDKWESNPTEGRQERVDVYLIETSTDTLVVEGGRDGEEPERWVVVTRPSLWVEGLVSGDGPRVCHEPKGPRCATTIYTTLPVLDPL